MKTENSKEMDKETTGAVSDLCPAATPAVQVDCLPAGWSGLEDLQGVYGKLFTPLVAWMVKGQSDKSLLFSRAAQPRNG